MRREKCRLFLLVVALHVKIRFFGGKPTMKRIYPAQNGGDHEIFSNFFRKCRKIAEKSGSKVVERLKIKQ